jgi:hypothetical protein
MTASTLARTPLAEIQRLRAELAQLRRLTGGLVDATSAQAEISYRQLLCTEAAERTRDAAWREGYEAAERDMARAWSGFAKPMTRHLQGPPHGDLEILRWGPGGREHFGDPRPGDYMGGPMPAW